MKAWLFSMDPMVNTTLPFGIFNFGQRASGTEKTTTQEFITAFLVDCSLSN